MRALRQTAGLNAVTKTSFDDAHAQYEVMCAGRQREERAFANVRERAAKAEVALLACVVKERTQGRNEGCNATASLMFLTAAIWPEIVGDRNGGFKRGAVGASCGAIFHNVVREKKFKRV